MELKKIDKSQYRKRLNIIIAGFIAVFAALALIWGSIFISLFSSQAQPTGAQTSVQAGTKTEVELTASNVQAAQQAPSNFKYNLAGVLVALLCCAWLLSRLKAKPFFEEAYYVWQLKQLHNRIYRKLVKIKQAGDDNNVNALIILYYYYKSLLQVYELDDNTLVNSKVTLDFNSVCQQIESLNLSIDESAFSADLLNEF